MTLSDLSRTILLVIGHPISKVRLARIVYFIHKDLIRKKFMRPEDIKYVRSPLGPIPNGFLTLERDEDDIVAQPNISSNLSYTSEDYGLSSDANEETGLLEQYSDMLKAIEHTLKILRRYPTPELIAKSHNEPSWQSHANGEIYTITPADLKVAFPSSTFPVLRIKIRFSGPSKADAMQANLLRGMLRDIVRESTDLEHPDQPASVPKPPKKSGVLRFTFRAGNDAKSEQKPNTTPSENLKSNQKSAHPSTASSKLTSNNHPATPKPEPTQNNHSSTPKPEHTPNNPKPPKSGNDAT